MCGRRVYRVLHHPILVMFKISRIIPCGLLRYTIFNDIQLSAENDDWNNIPQATMLAGVFVEYTLFSGTDAMIARKLMNLGIPVNVGTVENYRRLLLKSKGLETETFDFYLETMRQERKRSRKERKLQGVATNNDYESDL